MSMLSTDEINFLDSINDSYGIEWFLMSRDERKMANILVKKGYLKKGTAETKPKTKNLR